MVAVNTFSARRLVVALHLALAAGVAGSLPSSLALTPQDLADVRMGLGLCMGVSLKSRLFLTRHLHGRGLLGSMLRDSASCASLVRKFHAKPATVSIYGVQRRW